MPSCWRKRSADLYCRSAAFSFKSSRPHRLGKARDQWSARTGSPVGWHPGHRDVAQRSPSSVAALPSRRALGGAEMARAAAKAAGLESEPCATATYQIHGHGDGAGLKQRTPQPRHAIHLPPCRAEAIVKRTGERWRARKTADPQDRSPLRLPHGIGRGRCGSEQPSRADSVPQPPHALAPKSSWCRAD